VHGCVHFPAVSLPWGLSTSSRLHNAAVGCRQCFPLRTTGRGSHTNVRTLLPSTYAGARRPRDPSQVRLQAATNCPGVPRGWGRQNVHGMGKHRWGRQNRRSMGKHRWGRQRRRSLLRPVAGAGQPAGRAAGRMPPPSQPALNRLPLVPMCGRRRRGGVSRTWPTCWPSLRPCGRRCSR